MQRKNKIRTETRCGKVLGRNKNIVQNIKPYLLIALMLAAIFAFNGLAHNSIPITEGPTYKILKPILDSLPDMFKITGYLVASPSSGFSGANSSDYKLEISSTGMEGDNISGSVYTISTSSAMVSTLNGSNPSFNLRQGYINMDIRQLKILEIFVESSVDPIEGETKIVNFSFIVTDDDGIGDLDNNTVNATFTLIASGVGENMQLNDSSCDAASTGNNATVQNYTCSIGMRYFDRAATNGWLVNVSVSDKNGNSVTNNELTETKFSYTSLLAINMTPTSLVWPNTVVGQKNVLSNNDPLVITNIGNYNITTSKVNATAIDLGGETTTTEFIPAANFTANVLDACDTGTSLVNATSTNIGSSTLPTGLDIGEQASVEKLYFCLEDVPAAISQQSYSTINVGSWDIGVS